MGHCERLSAEPLLGERRVHNVSHLVFTRKYVVTAFSMISRSADMVRRKATSRLLQFYVRSLIAALRGTLRVVLVLVGLAIPVISPSTQTKGS